MAAPVLVSGKNLSDHSKKKFKATKELILLAMNEGMTQAEIARLCRVGQPQVSKWKKGAAKAQEHQLSELLEQFGHLLMRAPFKLYEMAATETSARRYIRVEGKILLKEVFIGTYDGPPSNKNPSAVRVTVHDQGAGSFVFLLERTDAAFAPMRGQSPSRGIRITDRHAVWEVCQVERQSMADLQVHIDELARSCASAKHWQHNYQGLRRLPFLLREALLNRGYVLEGIVEFNLLA